jgi:hypothetical protein
MKRILALGSKGQAAHGIFIQRAISYIAIYIGVSLMARLNINLAPEFQNNLQKLMRLRGIASKSEAVRL